MKRRIIQVIVDDDELLIALADDGTVWKLIRIFGDMFKWEKLYLPDLPEKADGKGQR